MQRNRRCLGCGVATFGDRCRRCAIAFRQKDQPLVMTRTAMPTSSWWTERDFRAAYQRELPRLLAVKVSGTPLPNVVMD